MRSLVIIPTYNESENLTLLVQQLLRVDPSLHVLIVDDNSPDGTGQLADALARDEPRLSVLHRPGKLGLGTAYVAGFTYALSHGYDAAIEMDADLSHRPADLPRLLHAAQTADVVIGSRNIAGGATENWSLARHLLSKGGSLYARMLLSLPVRDCTSGFKCLRRSALETLNLAELRSNGFGFQIEVNYLCARAGLRFAEVPIIFPDRQRGRSKMSWRITLEALRIVTGLYLHHGHLPGPQSPAAMPVASGAFENVPLPLSADEGMADHLSAAGSGAPTMVGAAGPANTIS